MSTETVFNAYIEISWDEAFAIGKNNYCKNKTVY